MHRHGLTLSCIVLATGLVAAQVPPGFTRGEQPSKVFDINKPPFASGANMTGGNAIMQVSFTKLPINKPGTWTACLTVRALNPAYGGDSSRQAVLMGVYDRTVNPPTFTPNKFANALNSNGTNDFGLMLGGSAGQYAVLDKASGAHIAERSNFAVAFGAPKPIGGVTGTYVDPSLGSVGGQLVLFWVENGQIVMANLNKDASGNWSIAATSKGAVATTVRSGGQLHSPTPINGADGDTEGLFLSDRVGTASDMYLADDLDPRTPHVLINTHTYWQNNGGIDGGMFEWADASSSPTPYYQATVDKPGAWLLGDREKAGQKLDITGAVFNNSSPFRPAITVLFMSPSLTLSPITIPNVKGQFGLGLTGLLPAFLGMPHIDRGELATAQIPIPPTLKYTPPLTLYIQGISFERTNQILSNTARLVLL